MISHYKTMFLFVFLSTLTLQGTPYRDAITCIHNRKYKQARQLLHSIKDEEAFSGNCMDFIDLLDALKNVSPWSSIPIFKIICGKGPRALEESLEWVLKSNDDNLLANFLKIEPVKDNIRQGFNIIYPPKQPNHSLWKRTCFMHSAEAPHLSSEKVFTYILSDSQRDLITKAKRDN